MTTDPPTRNKSEIERAIKEAANKNDMPLVLALAKELDGLKRQEQAADAARVQKVRDEANTRILAAARPVFEKFGDEIRKLGGVCRVVYDTNQEPTLISVTIGEKAAPKAASTGGSARAGSAMQRFGKPLDAIFKEHATAEEIAEHDGIPPDQNAKRWNLKKRVVKRAEESNLITPVAGS